MLLRSTERTIADLHFLLGNLQKNRSESDPVYFVQLQRIIRRRIDQLSAELFAKPAQRPNARAA